MTPTPGILARGPWSPAQVQARWHDDVYQPSETATAAADAAIAALAQRGSPSHDGVSARFVSHTERPDGSLLIEMQPARWGLRLVEGDASQSMAALCVTRAHDGRWLAGRRAAWLSTWAGRWALGAGGAVDVGESPVDTLVRELHEEWQLTAERVQVEAILRLPQQMILLVGQAWLPEGAQDAIVMDAEHDAHSWWPASIDDWPAEADAPLRYMAAMLAAGDA